VLAGQSGGGAVNNGEATDPNEHRGRRHRSRRRTSTRRFPRKLRVGGR
jgi:hypothetical protein